MLHFELSSNWNSVRPVASLREAEVDSCWTLEKRVPMIFIRIQSARSPPAPINIRGRKFCFRCPRGLPYSTDLLRLLRNAINISFGLKKIGLKPLPYCCKWDNFFKSKSRRLLGKVEFLWGLWIR